MTKLPKDCLYPEWDEFYLLVCDICGMIIVPQALEKHLIKKHRVNGKGQPVPGPKTASATATTTINTSTTTTTTTFTTATTITATSTTTRISHANSVAPTATNISTGLGIAATTTPTITTTNSTSNNNITNTNTNANTNKNSKPIAAAKHNVVKCGKPQAISAISSLNTGPINKTIILPTTITTPTPTPATTILNISENCSMSSPMPITPTLMLKYPLSSESSSMSNGLFNNGMGMSNGLANGTSNSGLIPVGPAGSGAQPGQPAATLPLRMPISSRYHQDRKWRNTFNVLRDTFLR